MRTARPAAGPPHPFFELRAQPFDMLSACLIFLDGDGPADPLVARERRKRDSAGMWSMDTITLQTGAEKSDILVVETIM